MREVRTTTLVTGQRLHLEGSAIRDGAWRPVDFQAAAILIKHPLEGPILFDTGHDPVFIAPQRPLPEGLYRWTTPVARDAGQDAASRRHARGFDPAAVRHPVLLRFHADHIAGTPACPNAALRRMRAGLDKVWRGSRFSSVRRGLLPALVAPDFPARARFVEDALAIAPGPDPALFGEGAHTLGDGSLTAVELPGHCPGHWGLVLNDLRWGRHVPVADAAWSLDARRRNMPSPAITGGSAGDTRRTRATLQCLHQQSVRNRDVRLTPCHGRRRAGEAQGEGA